MSLDRIHPPQKGTHIMLLGRMFLRQYQQRLVLLFGGEPGVAKPDVLNEMCQKASELSRDPSNTDIYAIIATYACYFVKRPFFAANLRLAAVSMAAVFAVNDYIFEPDDDDLVKTIKDLDSGLITKEELELWLKANSRKNQITVESAVH